MTDIQGNPFQRTQMLLGKEAVDKLKKAHVAVFGIGGVGGYVVEALARSGIGHLDIIDNDTVALSNLNRQIYALHSTIGQAKVDVAELRIKDINPYCVVTKHRMFYLPENADQIDLSRFDYVVDCVDTMAAKLELIRQCYRLRVPVICSMGAANKMEASAFRVADINETSVDPLAKVIRKKLRKEGIPSLKVVFSDEIPSQPVEPSADDPGKRRAIPASNAFVPATAGLILAGEVVKQLVTWEGTFRARR